jgi:hypothetical protein
MKLYRFSPISNEKECLEALEYIDLKLRELAGLVLEEKLPVNTLKIFAHYEDEYSFLRQWVDGVGARDEDNISSTSYYVKPSTLTKVNEDSIEYVGVRVPDPYRGQVGCGDFVVGNFEDFKAKHLNKSPYIREVSHQRYQMLELFHPDSDVLGYVVKEEV